MRATIYNNLVNRGLLNELSFTFSSSSGPGGQNVNRTSSKVLLRFDVDNSLLLSASEKEIINLKLKNRINANGILFISSQKSRSQSDNKKTAIHLFFNELSGALLPEKERIKTKPSKAARKRRLESKKRRAELKQNRKKLNY